MQARNLIRKILEAIKVRFLFNLGGLSGYGWMY